MSRPLLMLLGLALALASCTKQAERGPLVLAAASLQESLGEAADIWAAAGHARPDISFAASPALARQIESGAEADIFLSADQDWMDSVERSGHLRPATRRDLLANSLVLVAPSGALDDLALEPGPIGRAIGRGRLAMADPDSVPAGRYGKEALLRLGLWPGIERRIARAENVRAALALVARGEAPLGIVYATDAYATNGVQLIATFPAESHAPIIYPVALLSGSDEEAEAFYRFLLSRRARAIFAAHGFSVPASR